MQLDYKKQETADCFFTGEDYSVFRPFFVLRESDSSLLKMTPKCRSGIYLACYPPFYLINMLTYQLLWQFLP